MSHDAFKCRFPDCDGQTRRGYCDAHQKALTLGLILAPLCTFMIGLFFRDILQAILS